MSNYELVNFSAETLASTRCNWKASVDEDAFESELAPAFDWASKHLNHTDGDSVALRMNNIASDRTDAIVEIVTTRKGQVIKMLKVIPSPIFWDESSKREEIIGLYAEVFMNVITSKGLTPDHKVKIYGRSDAMMSILRSIHGHWQVRNSTADFEGRFLTITWS